MGRFLDTEVFKKIQNATTIEFEDNFQTQLKFLFDGDYRWVQSGFADVIFYDEIYADLLIVFIEKLVNPIDFVNNKVIRTMDLPKELNLKAKMSSLVEGELNE